MGINNNWKAAACVFPTKAPEKIFIHSLRDLGWDDPYIAEFCNMWSDYCNEQRDLLCAAARTPAK